MYHLLHVSYQLDVPVFMYLYNNTPSNAIVNAASDITYRPMIQTANTGRWFCMNELNDLSTVVIGKLSKLVNKEICSHDLDRKQKKKKNYTKFVMTFSYIVRRKEYHIICFVASLLYKLDTVLLKQKKLPVLDITGFWPSPEYSCGKSYPLYPIRATSFVSIVLYPILIYLRNLV